GGLEHDRGNWQPVAAGVGRSGAIDMQRAGVNAPGYSKETEVTIKIRYSHPGTRATVMQLEDGRAHVRLHDPQRAVTPGQAAVFYDGDIVLGGGWICRGHHPEPRKLSGSKDPVIVA